MIVQTKDIDRLSPVARDLFLKWRDFMYNRVVFNMPHSLIHARPHCERVLLYAMMIGGKMWGDDALRLEELAQSVVFHDSRREDEYLDTGHGARAAIYYECFCKENPDTVFHPATVFMMRYHDIDDYAGAEAIRKSFGSESAGVLTQYRIFKDADALDRWRLGRNGLDPKYLRTEEARRLVEFARGLVVETMPDDVLSDIERQVDMCMNMRKE